jgi:hypothetical protein
MADTIGERWYSTEPNIDFFLQDVTSEQVKERGRAIIEEARMHDGEAVLTYEHGDYWPVRIGKIQASSLPTEEGVDPHRNNLVLTDNQSIAFNGTIREFEFSVMLNSLSLYKSFKELVTNRQQTWFQIVIGDQAVNQFLADTLVAARNPVGYLRLARMAGLQPLESPELTASIEAAKVLLAAELVGLALEQRSLHHRIEAIRQSAGRGVIAFPTGLVSAPDTPGRARGLANDDRITKERNDSKIHALKQELLELDADPSAYEHIVSQLLGLALEAE